MLVIKGIGSAAGRVNEITPEFDARLLRWLAGYDKAILKSHLEEFAVTRTGNTVSVGSGLFFVYGYACYNSSIVTLTQQYGTGTSYAYVYLNIALSESTARFEIKLTVPSSTDTVSWTQNNLYTNPFGRYQQPIAKLTITFSAITVTNLRDELLKPYPQYAKQADDYTASGAIATKFGGIDTSISTLNSTKAPIENPAFTGGYTINPNTIPTTESIVINLTGNGQTLVLQTGNIDAGWYRIYLGGAGGGNGGYNNNGAGGDGGTGGVLDTKIHIPYRALYYTAAGGAGTAADNQSGSSSGGGGGGGASIFCIPQLGILLAATGGGGGGGRSWSGGSGSTGGSGGLGGGLGSGSSGGSSSGTSSHAGGAAGAGYPHILDTARRGSGGGVAEGGGNGYNNINANTGGGAVAHGQGWARVYRLS
jgi:hypothetical protein